MYAHVLDTSVLRESHHSVCVFFQCLAQTLGLLCFGECCQGVGRLEDMRTEQSEAKTVAFREVPETSVTRDPLSPAQSQ